MFMKKSIFPGNKHNLAFGIFPYTDFFTIVIVPRPTTYRQGSVLTAKTQIERPQVKKEKKHLRRHIFAINQRNKGE